MGDVAVRRLGAALEWATMVLPLTAAIGVGVKFPNISLVTSVARTIIGLTAHSGWLRPGRRLPLLTCVRKSRSDGARGPTVPYLVGYSELEVYCDSGSYPSMMLRLVAERKGLVSVEVEQNVLQAYDGSLKASPLEGVVTTVLLQVFSKEAGALGYFLTEENTFYVVDMVPLGRDIPSSDWHIWLADRRIN
ncbi:hypothetical protein SARC_01130 [Sphaeroforma arctica JP610]|uniref:Uncharacterized protein n=1 Tax=Sphaeroforma arctica JP610 TaxID=667725 RepID=A0A0L0GCY3_9EUKA|nr:hypothetical protein SARC_01130 [Sphaeroforma arctica JP610]KNC86751.1 hypothetical protein SARC_01130 [Sphaeroforma arctica JP610]|eukprot:XP_014160653.1 hypothetical protein SARC_01130 [Sphaeroforma arctica JP610]